MLTTAEARESILAAMPVFAATPIGVDDSVGRILRQSVVAERDQPPFDRVMMDGIALRFDELDAVIDELAKAMGLQGRYRKMSDTAERARSAVTWRIRSAIKKINAAHPRLGQHLSNSIRTGNFCVYSPESAIEWEL